MLIRSALGLSAAVATTALVTVAAPAADAAPTAPTDGSGHACSQSVDITAFSDALDKTTFDNTFVGNLSALRVDPDGGIDAVSDRSALFTLDPHTFAPQRVVSLADENGQPLDSEGLAIDHDGTRLISSELEPSVRRYNRDGTLLGRLPVPDSLRVAPAGRAGTNLTFEGLALQPGDHTLIASMEGALTGDDADLVRFQTWTRENPETDFALAAQHGYQVDGGLGVSDIAPTGDGRLLVLERGFTAGVGNTVRLYLADPQHATDVSGVTDLTAATGARLIAKTLLADIANCPSLGATAKQPQPNPLLDNIEGVTVLGKDHHRLRLLLVSDDNQGATQTTRLYSLTADLPER